METFGSNFVFQSDRAIASSEGDRLDRAIFVESLTNTLIAGNGSSSTGVTVGLTGKWGEGKTSILHLLEADIARRFPAAVVVSFSPWLVSQRHDLLHAFFNELSRAIQTQYGHVVHPGRISQLSEELADACADYVDRLSPIFDLATPGASKVAKGAAATIRMLMEIYRNRRATKEKIIVLKTRVEALLGELDAPIIVLVDEVDRISDGDVRELVHLIRAVADFPSVSYILAYDERRVAEALGFEATYARDRLLRGRK